VCSSDLAMPTPGEYRLRAEQCVKLAELAEEAYAKTTLAELAEEYNNAAEQLEHGDSHGDSIGLRSKRH